MDAIALTLAQEEERYRRLRNCLEAEASFQVWMSERNSQVPLGDIDVETDIQDDEAAVEEDERVVSTGTIETEAVLGSSSHASDLQIDISPNLAAAMRSELQAQLLLRACLEAELTWVEARSLQVSQMTSNGPVMMDISATRNKPNELEDQVLSQETIDDVYASVMKVEDMTELGGRDQLRMVDEAMAQTDDILLLPSADDCVQGAGVEIQDCFSLHNEDNKDDQSKDFSDDEEPEQRSHGIVTEVVVESEKDSEIVPLNDIGTGNEGVQLDTADTKETVLNYADDIDQVILPESESRMIAEDEDHMVINKKSLPSAEKTSPEDDSTCECLLDMSKQSQSSKVVPFDIVTINGDQHNDSETDGVTEISTVSKSGDIMDINLGKSADVMSDDHSNVSLTSVPVSVSTNELSIPMANEESGSQEIQDYHTLDHKTVASSHEGFTDKDISREELPNTNEDSDRHSMDISVELIMDTSVNIPTTSRVTDSAVSKPVLSSVSSQPTVVVPWLMPRTLEESNKMLRDERAQRMMLEQLTNLTQQECNGLRALLARETTTRMKMETRVADLKVELKKSQKEAGEWKERSEELEGSLHGTMILVKKLEEQSSTSLLSRGGIDYMLEAKLATNRANEAEQRNQMLQSELLQSQGEVKRLLDRLAEMSYERSEMVSGKVHSELMKIADNKTHAAETKAAELQTEIDNLKSQLSEHSSEDKYLEAKSTYDDIIRTGSLSYPSSFSYLPRTTSPYSSSMTSLSSTWSYPSLYPSSSSLLLQPVTSESLKPLDSSLFNSKPRDSSLFSSYTSDFLKDDIKAPTRTGSSKPHDRSMFSSYTSDFLKDDTKASTHTGSSKPHDRSMFSSYTPDFLKDDTKATTHTGSSKPPLTSPKPKRKTVSFQDPLTSSKTKWNDSDSSSFLLPELKSTGTLESEPPPPAVTPPVDKEKEKPCKRDDSDSSDWSSDEDDGVSALTAPPPVGSHADLVARWEWRATHGMQTEAHKPVAKVSKSPVLERKSITEQPTTEPVPGLTSPTRTHKPPLAPKPTVKQKQVGHAVPRMSSIETVEMEHSVSFDDDPALSEMAPSLMRLFSRPSGPANRRRPSRFRKD